MGPPYDRAANRTHANSRDDLADGLEQRLDRKHRARVTHKAAKAHIMPSYR